MSTGRKEEAIFFMVFPPKLEKKHVKIDRHFSPKIGEYGTMNLPNCAILGKLWPQLETETGKGIHYCYVQP